MTDSTNYLDPEFVAELKAQAKSYDDNQENSDNDKWVIARLVNSMWEEHKTLTYDGFTEERVYPTKAEFLVACSFQANQGTKKVRFSASGETLRRWCEIHACYANIKADHLPVVKESSFEHLRIAKSLNYNEKVSSPLVALALAAQNKWTAEEMKEHYDPPQIVHIYDKFTGWLDSMWNTKLVDLFKDKDDREEARKLLAKLRGLLEKNK